jgi:hypothetical protein
VVGVISGWFSVFEKRGETTENSEHTDGNKPIVQTLIPWIFFRLLTPMLPQGHARANPTQSATVTRRKVAVMEVASWRGL